MISRKNGHNTVKTFSKLICIPITSNFRNPVNITDKVREVVEQSGFRRGVVYHGRRCWLHLKLFEIPHPFKRG